MSPELKERISWWHLKAKNENDLWVRFVLYWIIFDAYLSAGSGTSGDSKKLRWFFDNQNSLKNTLDGGWRTKLVPSAKALKSLCPIKDMSPGSTKSINITDPENLEQVIRAIYQIRCNLFHGSKNTMSSRDSNLVEFAGKYMRDMVDWWLVN